MATHDYVIDNSTGANVRADINNALAAIVSNNSSSSEPSTKYAYMWWADTTNGVLKIRNSANDGWVELLQLDGTLTLEDGSASTPGLAFRDDLNTGIFSSAADNFDISTGGTVRLNVNGNITKISDILDVVTIRRQVQNSGLVISGGNATNDGANISLFGSTHSSQASNIEFRAGGTNTMKLDSSGRLLLGVTSVYSATGGGNMMLSIAKDATSRTDVSISNQNSADNASAALVLATHGQDYILEATGSGNSTDGASAFRISKGTEERFSIDTSGNVKINDSHQLLLENDAQNASAALLNSGSSGESALALATGGAERARLDNDGRLLVGSSSSKGIAGGNSKIQVQATDSTGRISIVQNRNEASGAPFLSLAKTRGTSVNSNTLVQNGDNLGTIAFAGGDGTDVHSVAAQIVGVVSSTAAANDMPGSIEVYTTPDGSDTPKQRINLTHKGEFQMGNTFGSGNILNQISRAEGNTTETFTTSQLGLDDNNFAMIIIVASGTNVRDYAHSIITWLMPLGNNSSINTQVDAMGSGSGVSTFTQAANGNDLVITKDSDLALNVTVIGGGGRRTTIGWG